MVVPCIISIFAPSILSLFVCFMFPEIEPAQSMSAQSIFPSQSLSRRSEHSASLLVFAAHFPETEVSQTAGALSHVVSWHCMSTLSLSASVPEFCQAHLLQV